jgi:hypothetical protein
VNKVVTLDGLLEREGQSTCVKFRCLLKSITIESGVHARYVIERTLGLEPGVYRLSDGNYMLKYTLEGQPQQEKVRIRNGIELLGGWLQ